MINIKHYRLRGNHIINLKTHCRANMSVLQYTRLLQKQQEEDAEADKARDSNAYNHFFKFGEEAFAKLTDSNTSNSSWRIIQYICSHMRVNTNKLKCTYTQISNKLVVSRPIISKTYKKLKKMKYMKTMNGNIFVNPDLASRVSKLYYDRIFMDYHFSNKKWWRNLKSNDEFTDYYPSSYR